MSTSSIKPGGRRLQQQSSEDGGAILADPPVAWANPGPVPGNPGNQSVKADTNVFSASPPVTGASIGFPIGQQVIVTANIAATGTPR